MSNSSLISYTRLSPNKNSPRNHAIDTITIHCYVGQASVEDMGAWFARSEAQASANYGIGRDGAIGMFVPESDRSWCTSSASNDNRAITIECACDSYEPYKINNAVYTSLIKLLVDVCKRNGIKKLLWRGDKSLIGQINKQNMTVHRWFANKSCPGDYLYSLHPVIVNRVNTLLGVYEPLKPVVDNSKTIWNYFKGKSLNDCAIAGIMGNLYAESGLNPKNVQDTFEKMSHYTDDTYTDAVDNNTYKSFIVDGVGYGLAQWTFKSRKEELLNYSRLKKVSVGDLQMQLEFLWSELSVNYTQLKSILTNANSVKEASDAVLELFEQPDDMSDRVRLLRASYGQRYYDMYADCQTVNYHVQVGAFKNKENAEKRLVELKNAGFDGIIIYRDSMWKVQENAFFKKENADRDLAKLKQAGFSDAFITT